MIRSKKKIENHYSAPIMSELHLIFFKCDVTHSQNVRIARVST